MTRRTLWLGAIAAAGGLSIVIGVLLVVPAMLYPPLPDADLQQVTGADTRIQLQQAQGQLQNDARSTLLQAIAGLLVVVGAAATWHQVQVNKDGQITDRFSRAVEHIGNDNVDIRIGGLYELERIANNSPSDRRIIQVTIGSYLRNRSPWPVGSPDGPQHPTPTVDENLPWLRMRAPDIQTALAILARRPKAPDAPRLYLSRVDLRSVQLENNQLTNAHIRRTNLARAWLRGTRLDGSDFYATDLRKANLEGVSLQKTSFRNAYLEGANLRAADLREADLRGADMRATHIEEALMTGAHADQKTIWPPEFTPETRRKHGIIEPTTEPAAATYT